MADTVHYVLTTLVYARVPVNNVTKQCIATSKYYHAEPLPWGYLKRTVRAWGTRLPHALTCVRNDNERIARTNKEGFNDYRADNGCCFDYAHSTHRRKLLPLLASILPGNGTFHTAFLPHCRSSSTFLVGEEMKEYIHTEVVRLDERILSCG